MLQIDEKNAPHVGGNTWAGGTGGRDTAGLGGKGGPYRLDAGHSVHQLSDEEKKNVPEDVSVIMWLYSVGRSMTKRLRYAYNITMSQVKRKAREMGLRARQERYIT